MTLEEDIVGLIASHLDIEKTKIRRESHFITDLGTDSLDILEIQMRAEDEYKITIPDDDVKQLTTVGDFIDYIVKRYQAPSK